MKESKKLKDIANAIKLISDTTYSNDVDVIIDALTGVAWEREYARDIKSYYYIKDYRKKVSLIMKAKYGITWREACGEDSPLKRAINYHETPEDFVSWWGDKYDLTPLVSF